MCNCRGFHYTAPDFQTQSALIQKVYRLAEINSSREISCLQMLPTTPAAFLHLLAGSHSPGVDRSSILLRFVHHVLTNYSFG